MCFHAAETNGIYRGLLRRNVSIVHNVTFFVQFVYIALENIMQM